MKRMGTFTIGAAAAALLAGSMLTAPAMAAPAAATQGLTKSTTDNVQQIRDGRRGGWGRHGHRHHRHGGGGWGWGVGAAAAGLLLGAPYLGAYDYDGYDDGYYGGGYAYSGAGGYARCEATFRSFDPASGTYMGYDGIRRTCPYL
jgi:hypothetical protein